MVSSSLLFYKVFNEEKVTLKNTVTIPFPEDTQLTFLKLSFQLAS